MKRQSCNKIPVSKQCKGVQNLAASQHPDMLPDGRILAHELVEVHDRRRTYTIMQRREQRPDILSAFRQSINPVSCIALILSHHMHGFLTHTSEMLVFRSGVRNNPVRGCMEYGPFHPTQHKNYKPLRRQKRRSQISFVIASHVQHSTTHRY
jgi:hypothetical protein